MAQEAESTPQEGQTPAPATEMKVEVKPEGDAKSFDADYVKSLRSENAQHRKKAQELEGRLQEIEERDQSEVEKAKGKLTKAEQRAADAESKLIRYQVAQEKAVPAKLVPLLTAADKEGLEAQADLILENAIPVQVPDFDAGVKDPAPDPKTPDQAHNELAAALFGVPRT